MQLAAEDNMQICQPSTAAQYFHMLRRQARRTWRKPLIVFTPKSMLRHPDASSNIEDFTRPHFLPLVPDHEVQDAKRILIASGKVGHELRAERRRRNTPMRAKSCGSRKSPPTWERFSTCCPGLSDWRKPVACRCGR